jgi:hypothetical protein
MGANFFLQLLFGASDNYSFDTKYYHMILALEKVKYN